MSQSRNRFYMAKNNILNFFYRSFGGFFGCTFHYSHGTPFILCSLKALWPLSMWQTFDVITCYRLESVTVWLFRDILGSNDSGCVLKTSNLYFILAFDFSKFQKTTQHKKWSFPLRISSVNVTKSAADLVTFTEETLNGKVHFVGSSSLI